MTTTCVFATMCFLFIAPMAFAQIDVVRMPKLAEASKNSTRPEADTSGFVVRAPKVGIVASKPKTDEPKQNATDTSEPAAASKPIDVVRMVERTHKVAPAANTTHGPAKDQVVRSRKPMPMAPEAEMIDEEPEGLEVSPQGDLDEPEEPLPLDEQLEDIVPVDKAPPEVIVVRSRKVRGLKGKSVGTDDNTFSPLASSTYHRAVFFLICLAGALVPATAYFVCSGKSQTVAKFFNKEYDYSSNVDMSGLPSRISDAVKNEPAFMMN